MPVGPGPHDEVKEGAIWVEYIFGFGTIVNPDDPEYPEVKKRNEDQERELREVLQRMRDELERRIEHWVEHLKSVYVEKGDPPTSINPSS